MNGGGGDVVIMITGRRRRGERMEKDARCVLVRGVGRDADQVIVSSSNNTAGVTDD